MTDSGGSAGSGGIAAYMGALSRILEDETDPGAVLDQIVAAAKEQVPGAEHAGVTLLHKSGVQTPASTGELVVNLDVLQHECGQGPYHDAAAIRGVVRVDAMGEEERWPLFAPSAARLGVGSMMSFCLFVVGHTVGALNIVSCRERAFGEAAEDIGAPLAAHAAVAAVSARERANLRSALSSRDVIGQASGILMERRKITAQAAFEVLSRASQDTNVKLRDVAERLVETGTVAASDAVSTEQSQKRTGPQ